MKHLERTPGSLRPPDPATILLNLPWLSGLGPDVVNDLIPHANLLQLEQGDWLLPQGAESRGIYVIVSGLVKVCAHMLSIPSINVHVPSVLIGYLCFPTDNLETSKVILVSPYGNVSIYIWTFM